MLQIGIAMLALALAVVATWAAGRWLDRGPSTQPPDPTYDTRRPRP